MVCGVKMIGDEWPDSTPVACGLLFAVQPENSTVGLEFGIYGVMTNEIFENVYVSDYHAGIIKSRQIGRSNADFYVGGGAGFVSAEREVSLPANNYRDRGFTAYVHSGVLWHRGRNFNLGLDLRYDFGPDLDLNGDYGAAGTSAGLFLGWGM